MAIIPKNKQLILFDGVCNLCNNSVLYVIKRDKHDKFLFAPLQSKIGESIINEFNIDTTKTDSILLYQPSKRRIFDRSSAALFIELIIYTCSNTKYFHNLNLVIDTKFPVSKKLLLVFQGYLSLSVYIFYKG